MQDPSSVDLGAFNVEYLIGRSRLDVRIEHKRHEEYHEQKIDRCTDSTHGLGAMPEISIWKKPEGDEYFVHVNLFGLGHISTLQISVHERRPEPFYQTVGAHKGHSTESQRSDQWLAIAL